MKKIEVYTDGAASNNGYEDAVGGWAYTIYIDDILTTSNCGKLKCATNQQMELRAIIEGCKAAKAFGEAFTVYSDSAYAMNCKSQKWYKKWQVNNWRNAKKEPVANRFYWEELIPFFNDENIVFIKVKGHANDERNNEVDKMAVIARIGGTQ